MQSCKEKMVQAGKKTWKKKEINTFEISKHRQTTLSSKKKQK